MGRMHRLGHHTHRGTIMSTVARFLRRDPAEVEPWAETCGQIRPLVEEADGAAGEVHHVEIEDAKLHFHERTDEFYYVIDGTGTMILDDEEIELHAGLVIYVPRGVKHKAKGNLTVLTVCIPRGVMGSRRWHPAPASTAFRAAASAVYGRRNSCFLAPSTGL